MNRFSRIGAPSARRRGGKGSLALKRQIAQIAALDTEKLCHLVQLKCTQRFLGCRWKQLAAVSIQPVRKILSLA